ncbi:MAG TPA: helix-turn-helix transcriptional regulator [Kineosporiaceae bacterium]|nr:helix-turn-helix transcriptional regulator [Kineosporiaceae bacterium]
MARFRSPASDRRQLATSLRALREGAELSLEDAASRALDASAAKLSRIETGKQIAGPRDVRDLCHLYGVDEAQTAALVELASFAREAGWWEAYDIHLDDYIGLETAASRIQQFENSVVPGLLQTKSYAAEYLEKSVNHGRPTQRNKSEIQEFLKMQHIRQKIVAPDSGVEFAFVLDEAALRRAVGGAEMRSQVAHIMQVAQYPNVRIQVLPLSIGASPGQQGGFTVLTLPADVPNVAYVETLAGFMLLESAEELSRFKTLFEVLQKFCPDEARTLEELARILRELP